VTFSGDPAYPSDAVVFTVDPEGKGTAQRGIAATRNLRQTFQVPVTFNVDRIVAGINVDNASVTSGLQIRIYEVADVLANWAPGNLIKQFIFPTLPAELGPASTLRMGLTLTGSDIFTLPARNAATEGYGIEFSNNDGVSTFGQLRHTSDGTNYYPGGQYYSESAAFATRDMGLALAPAPGSGFILGDTDGDGTGGEFPDDFNPIKMNFRKAVTMRSQGDLVPNGIVDFADFREWKAAFLGGRGSLEGIDLGFAASVPEPATWLLAAIACGALANVGRCRRRVA
jgi:hypothetical protein